MVGTTSTRSQRSRVGRYAWALAGVWTLVNAVLMWREYGDEQKHLRDEARTEARANLNKNQAIRLWAAAHGGVYVPPDAHTPPNPYLAHVPERDIETPSGQKLTLMNPAYILRQLGEEHSDLYGVRDHLTSLKPLRPENAPDEWERQALESFERGLTEALEFTETGGDPVLRVMRPLIVEEACLKCHGQQGYQVGDVRGGMGVVLPLTRLREAMRVEMFRHARNFTFLWLLGLGGIGLSSRRLLREERVRNRAEEMLRENEERMAMALEGTDEGLWDWDMVTGGFTLDDNWLRVLGYEPGEREFDFGWWIDSLHRDSEPVFEKSLSAYLAGEEKYYELEYRIRDKRGDWRWIWARGKCVEYDSDGQPLRMIGTNHDITERKRMEQELQAHAENLERRVEERTSRVRELERQRGDMEKLAATGRMAAAVAHEINNPLAGIKNAFLLLKDAIPTDHEDYHFAELILREIERIANIVRQMNQLYHPNSVKPVEVDVASELSDVCEMLDQKRKQRLLRFHTDPIPALTQTVLPAGHLRQILYNLIVNAIEASPEGGEIRLSVTSSDDTVCIGVSDDGEGIPPDILDGIFEPFFTTKNRVDQTGMGLGLPVSQSLARAMGGNIIVESGMGKKTAFILVLPCEAPPKDVKGTAHE